MDDKKFAADPSEEVTIEFSIDSEVEKEFRDLIAPTGFTLEQLAQMFLCWCAHYPEDATAWLKWAAQEQGAALDGKIERTI